MKTIHVIAVVAGLAVGGGCADRGDANASLACRDFRQTAADFPTLTFDELRGRIRNVDDHAKVSEDSAVRGASRDLLTLMTNGAEEARLAEAVNRLGNACESAGF